MRASDETSGWAATLWRWLPAGLVVVVLVIGGVAYANVVPVHRIDRSRLSQLVVDPPQGFTPRPAASEQVATSTITLSGYKAAARHDPDHTGAYSVAWKVPHSTTDYASLLVLLFPSAHQALGATPEARKTYLSLTSSAAESYRSLGSSTVPGVPGASVALFAGRSSSAVPRVANAVFQHGRVVVAMSLGGSAARVQGELDSFARAQYQHLVRVEPGFTLVGTHLPLVASIVWVAVMAVVVLVILLARPTWRGAVDRRTRAREAARRRARMSRGHKVVRRQAR